MSPLLFFFVILLMDFTWFEKYNVFSIGLNNNNKRMVLWQQGIKT
jgi:hypothetical protein